MRSEDLARSASTNPAVIRSLLSRLGDAGLSKARLGAGGGTLLARAADRISLLDVYLAVEDPELFPLHRCPPDKNCVVGKYIQGGRVRQRGGKWVVAEAARDHAASVEICAG